MTTNLNAPAIGSKPVASDGSPPQQRVGREGARVAKIPRATAETGEGDGWDSNGKYHLSGVALP